MSVTSQIAILGAPVTCGNRGVMALGASMVGLCWRSKDVSIQFLLGHRQCEKVPFRVAGEVKHIEIVNCRLSIKAKLSEHLAWIVLASILYRLIRNRRFRSALSRCTPWIAALEQANIVGDIRGGDSFSDIYGMRRFVHGFLMAWTVLLVRGSIIQFPQTFGPYKNRISRLMARYLLRRSSVIMARDRESQQIAQQLVGTGKEVLLCPDVAFALEAYRPRQIIVEPSFDGQELPRPIIGLNINALVYNGGDNRSNMFGLRMDYKGLLPELIEALVEKHPGEIWLIPHTYDINETGDSIENDLQASRKVWQALAEKTRKRVKLVAGDYDCHELKWLIGQCEFFIGSRMHSCIAALSQGIPCVGIAYSRKFKGVFETVGMTNWVIDAQQMTNEQALEHIMALYLSRDRVRRQLAERASAAKAEVERTISTVITRCDS